MAFPVELPRSTHLARPQTSVADLTASVAPKDVRPALVYLAGLAPGSRRTMRQVLDTVARMLTGGELDAEALAWGRLGYQHTAAVRSALADRYAPATTNKSLAAIRGVLRAAWRLGQMTAEEYHRAADLPSVSGMTLPRGRALSQGELRSLFSACASTPGLAGARDGALIALLYGAGLRRSEAVSLDHADYDQETRSIAVRRGKGNKARLVQLGDGARRAVEAWVKIRGSIPGPLLLPVLKSGRVELRRLTDQAVLLVLRRRAVHAGVRSFSPHDLRRSFVSDLLDAGADVAIVQRLAGHANVQTTSRYDRRGEAAQQRAAALLHVPYGII
jgi:site-specific recombinase XerD